MSSRVFDPIRVGSQARELSGNAAAMADAVEGDQGHGRSVANSGTVLDMEWMINLRGEEWLASQRDSSWWTGLAPESCPGWHTDGLGSLPLLNLDTATRDDWQQYFDNTWTLTEALFAGLQGEEPFFRPPVHGLRHPLIFYYGHTACLYVNKLRISGALDGPVNLYYEQILETGVDEMSWDDMHKNDMVWPTVEEVKQYRQNVYNIISELIATHPELDEGAPPIRQGSQLWPLAMSFEHERIHLETSSVLIREQPFKNVQTPPWWLRPHASHLDAAVSHPENSMLPVQAGQVALGKPLDHPSFGWDNEYGTRTVTVPKFSASKYMVTNGEFLEFVKDGGYTADSLWSKEGWGWRAHRNAKWPFFWHPQGPSGLHQYKLRTIFEMVDLPPAWPAEVNMHEATAFAEWKAQSAGGVPGSYRMITEVEHHRLRDANTHTTAGEAFTGNTNLAHGSGTPVDLYPATTTGHHDVFGNAWEWTSDHFNPLEGFEVHPTYTDFSTPCFDGRHNLIMGGSFVSSGDESTAYARFHFRPHFLQHSGFRLVQSEDPAPAHHLGAVADSSSTYESEEMLEMYKLLHFGDAAATFGAAEHETNPEGAVAFPKRCAEQLTAAFKAHGESSCGGTRALDIGCAVGGATLELTRGFDEVLGIDFSQSFVDAAREIQKNPDFELLPPLEGALRTGAASKSVVDPDLPLAHASFRVGDACALDSHSLGGPFDAVLMANLICRVPDPVKTLQDLSQANNGVGIVREGGVLMLVTPFSWNAEYTPQDKWLGGQHQDDAESFDGLVAALGTNFELVDRFQLPLVIREHRRRWQYIVPDAAIFKRVS